LVLGLDEAGRGPLAGPVVAAAVALRRPDFRCRIDDSKQLSPAQRETAMQEICAKAYVGIGVINESVIDRCNVSEATYFAMTNAVWQLIGRLPRSWQSRKNFPQKVFLLVDGKYFHSDMPFAYRTIIQGDRRCLSIACASIVAKVTRDRILNIYHQVFPRYNFKGHKGYPTAEHVQAIRAHGPSEIHRRTFRGVL